jgi:hypothetical protein
VGERSAPLDQGKIYSKFDHPSHKDFTKEDHEDAAKIHNRKGFDLQEKTDILDGKKTKEWYVTTDKKAESHFNEKEKHLIATKK